MAEQSNSPFECIDDILKTVEHDVVIIDFHAEATAEKRAMAYYVDGRVNVLFGTHTHVQTADEEIFEKGLGFITDLGMTGPKNSVIGMNVEASLKRFTTSIPERYKLADGECKLNSVVFELDDKTLKCKKIYRVNL
jgi:calcineurin-like phosphoesterase